MRVFTDECDDARRRQRPKPELPIKGSSTATSGHPEVDRRRWLRLPVRTEPIPIQARRPAAIGELNTESEDSVRERVVCGINPSTHQLSNAGRVLEDEIAERSEHQKDVQTVRVDVEAGQRN